VGGFTVSEWKKYGKDRLYIARGGQSVGYYDRQTSKLHVDDPDLRYSALEALAPFLSGEISALGHAIQATPPPPGMDLTSNSAGEAVAKKAAELAPNRFQRYAARLLRIRTEAASWETGAAGERRVGGRLDLLKANGWNVLHSVTLKSGADIDHVVIGPGGVFTVNTKHHAGAQIRAKGDFVRVNGHLQPYVRNSRHEASAASRRLSNACGFPVPVIGVIAFVDAASVDVRDAPADILIVPGNQLERLFLAVPQSLAESVQKQIFAVARRAEIWRA
jgi:hypothetical protein